MFSWEGAPRHAVMGADLRVELAASGFVVPVLMPVNGYGDLGRGSAWPTGRAPRTPGLVRNDGADVVRPVRFTAAAGRLLGLDRAATALADFPCGVSRVIFPRMPVAFVEVGIRESLALARDIAVLRCISGGHLYSLDQTPRRNATLHHPA